jgi:NTP pyrophosphatase (non-canonical NTP hydrolase)
MRIGARMRLGEFQRQVGLLYGEQDAERGLARTFAWFTEECGELSRAIFRGDRANQIEEFSDVLAWLASLAEQAGIDLEEAAQRYADGCPRCGAAPCDCSRTKAAR